MDDDTKDLIRLLCTRAGMIMEDASTVALVLPISDDAALKGALDSLRRSTSSMSTLIDAAFALANDSGGNEEE